jgi:hypothetical protein
MAERRKVGRPKGNKVYVNSNRKMLLSVDTQIRKLLELRPEKYTGISSFINIAISEQIRRDVQELYMAGELESMGALGEIETPGTLRVPYTSKNQRV